MGTDAVWSRLSRVCVELGLNDEAVQAYREIEIPHLYASLGVLLARHGLISVSELPVRRSESSQDPSSGSYAQAEDYPESGFRHLVTDAFEFLFLDHMPLTVTVASLTFPLVVGLGGFLTADSHFLLFSVIALLPGLAVVGIVGALGRRIMIDAGQGLYDPPPVPDFRTLCREAPRFILDMLVLCLVFLGPGTLALLLLPNNLMAALGALALGMFVMPMALLLNELSNDWRALSPRVLLRAIGRGGLEYAKTSLVICALILPAVLSAVVTMGSQFYLQVSIIGPLIVVPLFVSCRLLGNLFHSQQAQLQDLVGEAPPEDYPEEFEEETDLEPELMESPATHPDPPQPPPRAPSLPEPTEAPRHSKLLDELPDLSNLPGAHIVRREDRERAGAASRREA